MSVWENPEVHSRNETRLLHTYMKEHKRQRKWSIQTLHPLNIQPAKEVKSARKISKETPNILLRFLLEHHGRSITSILTQGRQTSGLWEIIAQKRWRIPPIEIITILKRLVPQFVSLERLGTSITPTGHMLQGMYSLIFSTLVALLWNVKQ